MHVEVLKNELAGALSALKKLVCRKAPVELYRSLRIEGKDGIYTIYTPSFTEYPSATTAYIPASAV